MSSKSNAQPTQQKQAQQPPTKAAAQQAQAAPVQQPQAAQTQPKWRRDDVVRRQQDLVARASAFRARVPQAGLIPGHYLGVDAEGRTVVLTPQLTQLPECEPRVMPEAEADRRYELARQLTLLGNTVAVGFAKAWREPAEKVMAAADLAELAKEIQARPPKVRATVELGDFAQWLLQRVQAGDTRSAAELALEYARLLKGGKAQE